MKKILLGLCATVVLVALTALTIFLHSREEKIANTFVQDLPTTSPEIKKITLGSVSYSPFVVLFGDTRLLDVNVELATANITLHFDSITLHDVDIKQGQLKVLRVSMNGLKFSGPAIEEDPELALLLKDLSFYFKVDYSQSKGHLLIKTKIYADDKEVFDAEDELVNTPTIFINQNGTSTPIMQNDSGMVLKSSNVHMDWPIEWNIADDATLSDDLKNFLSQMGYTSLKLKLKGDSTYSDESRVAHSEYQLTFKDSAQVKLKADVFMSGPLLFSLDAMIAGDFDHTLAPNIQKLIQSVEIRYIDRGLVRHLMETAAKNNHESTDQVKNDLISTLNMLGQNEPVVQFQQALKALQDFIKDPKDKTLLLRISPPKPMPVEFPVQFMLMQEQNESILMSSLALEASDEERAQMVQDFQTQQAAQVSQFLDLLGFSFTTDSD